jgi:hypothetical protein
MMDTTEDISDRPANGQPAHRRWIRVVALVGLTALPFAGCASPEDGRPRGGGAGADGGNYRRKPIHAPSKIDDTKPLPNPFPLASDAP